MKLVKYTFILCFMLMISSCSLMGKPENEGPLRDEYSEKTIDKTQRSHYLGTVWITAGVGALSQSIPALHLGGMVADAVIVVQYFDEFIYGLGAIIAREKDCPALLEKVDYWNVLGTWFNNIKSTAEFDALLGVAPAATPFISRQKAGELFLLTFKKHGASLVGAKLAALIVAKLTAKGLAGFVPVLGPVVAAGINWYIFNRLNDAGSTYFNAKARFVCGR